MTLHGNEPRCLPISAASPAGAWRADAQKDGRMAECHRALDAAIAISVAPTSAVGRSSGSVAVARASGLRRRRVSFALPLLEEAIPFLAADPPRKSSWTTAIALRGRLLERLDRVADALPRPTRR